jgi:hypothetical protein
MGEHTETRRRFVHAAGTATVLAIAGCLGGGDGGGDNETTTDTGTATGAFDEELPSGVSRKQFREGPVPAAYRTARSQGDERRDPDDLFTKAQVQFQEASEAREKGLAQAGSSCENCADFIPDKNGDGFGACAEVEGYVGAEDWCSAWEALDDEEDDGTEGS